MQSEVYEALVKRWKKKQYAHMTACALIAVLGILLAATVIGPIASMVCFCILLLAIMRMISQNAVRRKTLKEWETQDKLADVYHTVETAQPIEMDGLTYFCTGDYFVTGYGAVYPMRQIAWIFQFTHKVNFLFLTMARQRWCKLMLLDGTERLAFWGKPKDTAAFENLLQSMRRANPNLLVGFSNENAALYAARCEIHKASKTE